MSGYDYDLITIGAGSGGVRASRLAASFGAKVAVVERAPAAVEMPTRVDNAVVDPAKESAEYDSLPLVFELNAAQQKQYLPLRLDAHVYSTDPGKRFVVLNGKRYAEGDITEAKLLIHKIIREGVVFSKDDRSFRVLR